MKRLTISKHQGNNASLKDSIGRDFFQVLIDRLAEYEDAEEQGLLIRAKNGDCDNCNLYCGNCGSCMVFGYQKEAQVECRKMFALLKGSVSK